MVALKKWYALAALVLCVLVIGLDATILNLALAALATDLGASTGELQWIVAAYLITLSALLLPAGLAGDRWGRKKLLLGGVALFGVASLLAAFADDTAVLIAARAAMGVGAAIIMPLTMSFLPIIFPPHERTKAISIWSVGMALGLPLGPILGGWLLENYWWGSVLLINIPVVLVAFVAAAILLPESKDPHARRLDPLSVIFSVFGLGLLVFGVIEAPTRGWGHVLVLTCLSLGIVLIGLFTIRNLRRAQPLVDLTLLGNRTFAWGTLATVLASLALMGLLFVLPLSLQAVSGLSALQTGIRLIPLILGLAVAGRLAPKVCAKLGTPATIAAGMLMLAGGFALGTLIANTTVWLTVIGLGLGLAMVPAMDAVLATLPAQRSGAGSGLVQTLRQVAGAFAVAGLGSLLSSVYRANLPASAPQAARESIVAAAALPDEALFEQAKLAFQEGMHAVLLTSAAAALVGAILVALFLPRSPEPAVVQESDHDLARVA